MTEVSSSAASTVNENQEPSQVAIDMNDSEDSPHGEKKNAGVDVAKSKAEFMNVRKELSHDSKM